LQNLGAATKTGANTDCIQPLNGTYQGSPCQVSRDALIFSL